jgi:hypothetical protein
MADKTSVLRGPKSLSTKTRSVARTMTTGTQVATLPKGSRIIGFLLNGVASDAGTTATLSIGSTTTATEYVNGADVKTAASGVGPTLLPGVSGVLGTVLTVDTGIFVKYAESGTASAAGAWKVTILYTTGNVTNDDTI